MNNISAQDLIKSLEGAIDKAMGEIIEVEKLAKGDISLQDVKLHTDSPNGSLPGDNSKDSALKAEDAKKGDLKITHTDDDCDDEDEDDKAKKAEKDEDDKKSKKDKDDDGDEDDDMDDVAYEKMKAKMKKYEDGKSKKVKKGFMGDDSTVNTTNVQKSEADKMVDALSKSIEQQVGVLEKHLTERVNKLEEILGKIAGAPQPRKSVSGLAPLAKSAEDLQSESAAPLSKSQVIDKLFELQKNGDKRVDSSVIARVEFNDFSVLAERNINLK
jgi:hypothetical protein